jgi:hypothetical protein
MLSYRLDRVPAEKVKQMGETRSTLKEATTQAAGPVQAASNKTTTSMETQEAASSAAAGVKKGRNQRNQTGRKKNGDGNAKNESKTAKSYLTANRQRKNDKRDTGTAKKEDEIATTADANSYNNSSKGKQRGRGRNSKFQNQASEKEGVNGTEDNRREAASAANIATSGSSTSLDGAETLPASTSASCIIVSAEPESDNGHVRTSEGTGEATNRVGNGRSNRRRKNKGKGVPALGKANETKGIKGSPENDSPPPCVSVRVVGTDEVNETTETKDVYPKTATLKEALKSGTERGP